MMKNSEIILETSRLSLLKPEVSDAPFMLRLVNDPSWLQYIGDRNVHTIEEAEQYLLKGTIHSFQTKGFGFGMVELKSTEETIGMCGFVKRDFLEDVDLGFAFLPEFTGQGYAYEIASACMAYAKAVLKLNKLCAIVTPDNLSSIKLLKKLGFQNEGFVRHEDEDLFLFKTHIKSISQPVQDVQQ